MQSQLSFSLCFSLWHRFVTSLSPSISLTHPLTTTDALFVDPRAPPRSPRPLLLLVVPPVLFPPASPFLLPASLRPRTSPIPSPPPSNSNSPRPSNPPPRLPPPEIPHPPLAPTPRHPNLHPLPLHPPLHLNLLPSSLPLLRSRPHLLPNLRHSLLNRLHRRLPRPSLERLFRLRCLPRPGRR